MNSRNELDPEPDFVDILWTNHARHAEHGGKRGIL